MFSFAIKISDDEGEEARSSQAIGISSVEIRAKLEDLLALLHQDTAQLVDDSDPTKVLFKALRGQIPADAKEKKLKSIGILQSSGETLQQKISDL